MSTNKNESRDYSTWPFDELIEHWLGRDRAVWAADSERYRKAAERFLKLSEYLLAYDVATEGLEVFKDDASRAALRIRLQQLQGLALARSGAPEKANAIFAALRKEGYADEETLGMLARTHKDLGLAASGEERAGRLRQSHEIYAAAYEGKEDNYWTGINAATTALLLGDAATAREFASEVRQHCLAKCPEGRLPEGDGYWLAATIAEAELILGQRDEAERWYRSAVAAAPGDWGSIASTRRSARLIAEALGDAELRASVDRWLPLPTVVVFAGHMIDQPSRATPRFPVSLEGAVKEAIHAKLAELDAGIGFASGACGSDILFLEAMRERGGKTQIVLPYKSDGFIRDSVDIVPGGNWGARLKVLLGGEKPIEASPQPARLGSVTYDYANTLLHGLAKIRADQLETRLVPLVVWDGRPGDGRGGTADIVAHWRALGYEPAIINLAALLRAHAPQAASTDNAPLSSHAAASISPLPREIKAMLFADVEHFSRIVEERFPRFVEHFMRGVARLSAGSSSAPVMSNTWGDALFLVFDSVEQAGAFALDLCDFMKQTRWAEVDLPETLNLRIALHAGPVFEFADPVSGKRNFIGTHVNRAARLEPVTPPGHVYASQEFAAIAALRLTGFVCDYAGQIPFPKEFGTFPTYHVRRR